MTFPRIAVLCFFLLFSTAAWSKVFVRWTRSDLPPIRVLGIGDLVVPWSDKNASFVKAARQQGYRVYAEIPFEQLAGAMESVTKSGLAGLVVEVSVSDHGAAEAALHDFRTAHPGLKLLLNHRGKQPQMRGSLVIKRDSVLEVSSPTAQPWIDTNLALIKAEQRIHPGQTPLYNFSWDGSGFGQRQQPLTSTDYSLALAEACAFQADLMLDLEDSLQKALGDQDSKVMMSWKQVLSYVEFCAHAPTQGLEPAANVGVVVDDLGSDDEVMNLLARHNIPFKVLLPGDLNAKEVDGFDVFVMFARGDRAALDKLNTLAADGKTVVVVQAKGPYPWDTRESVRVNEHTVSFSIGKGRVLELSEPVTDPETFAQDIRRLLGKQNALISLWNGLTTIAVPYRLPGGPVNKVEFINYAAEPVRVQVQIRGSFSSIRYEAPGHKCCTSLTLVKHDGFTEFVIPDLVIAGRVHLEAEPAVDSKKAVGSR